ncbi:DUF4328 domain-containing protein [Streptomyces sp. ACA25]|nr:protein kinase [Streptomyces sp. ACA25]MDB1086022.1 DUF4328 domain-containing protein [Streptomyces sp. ACA25]
MGSVYLARSERGRTVAVKTIRSAFAAQPEFRSRFAQEISTARRVAGPWTAAVLDADTEAAVPWLATSYIAGPSLQQVVDTDYGPLPEHTVLTLASGLVQALQEIHSAGLIHRDLKPSNILITIDGPRVIDFGIARALDVLTAGGLTRTGAVVGSPGFMSPEQVRGQRLTTASDIFCLGSVLAYATTGTLPFGTSDSGGHALMFRIAQEEPLLDGIPEPLRRLIADCLTKDPDSRPTLAVLRQQLEEHRPAGPWLPGEVLAELGRHAVRLLDSEGPESDTGDHTRQPLPDRPGLPPTPPPPVPAGQGSGPAPYPPATAHPQQAAGWAPPYQGYQAGQAYQTPAPQWQHPHLPQGAGAAAYGSSPSAYGVLPLQRFARRLHWLFGLLMVFTVGSLAFHLALLADLQDMESATSYRNAVERIDTWQSFSDVLGVLSGLLWLTVAVVWLLWFRRARRNAETFSPGRIRFGPAMAVGAWLIPFAMLWLPKQITDDVWRASGGYPPPGKGVVDLWWLLWLCVVVPAYLPPSWTTWYETETLAAAKFQVTWESLLHVPVLLAAVAAMVFVHRLSAMQAARAANGA